MLGRNCSKQLHIYTGICSAVRAAFVTRTVLRLFLVKSFIHDFSEPIHAFQVEIVLIGVIVARNPLVFPSGYGLDYKLVHIPRP